jgi:Flp pilus assembly protein TadG
VRRRVVAELPGWQTLGSVRAAVRRGLCLLRGGQAASALVWTAAMMPFFLSVIGLTLDGAVVFAVRRELQNVADGAAQAAVTRVDTALYEQTGTVALDREAAVQAVAEHVSGRRPEIAWTVEPDAQGVVVEVGSEVPLAFLRLLGWRTVYLTARAPAALRHGIEATW